MRWLDALLRLEDLAAMVLKVEAVFLCNSPEPKVLMDSHDLPSCLVKSRRDDYAAVVQEADVSPVECNIKIGHEQQTIIWIEPLRIS
jgi:hypothetical protein